MGNNKLPSKVYYNFNNKVQITKIIINNNQNSFEVDISNGENDILESITLQLRYLDSYNNYLNNGKEYVYSRAGLSLRKGNKINLEFSISEDIDDFSYVEIRIEKLIFQNTGEITIEREGEISVLEPLLDEEYRNKLTNSLGKDMVTYSQDLLDKWRCVCGYINLKSEEECNFCERSQSFVLEELNKNKIDQRINIKPQEVKKTEKKENEIKKEKGKSKVVIIGAATLALILLVTSGIFYFKNQNYKNRIANADSMVQNGDYKRALDSYNILNNEKSSQDLVEKIDRVEKLVISDENFNKGLDALISSDYVEAMSYFDKVSKEDKENYDKLVNHFKMIDNEIIGKINSHINNNEQEEAIDLINKYLEIRPNSTEIGKLKNEIYNRKEKEIENAKKEAENVKKEAEEARIEAEKAKENLKNEEAGKTMQKLADILAYSYQTIIPNEANIRSGPSVNSGVVKVVPSGSSVYIYDTIIEGTTRIWCNAEVYDYKTGEIYYGWVSSKVLGY